MCLYLISVERKLFERAQKFNLMKILFIGFMLALTSSCQPVNQFIKLFALRRNWNVYSAFSSSQWFYSQREHLCVRKRNENCCQHVNAMGSRPALLAFNCISFRLIQKKKKWKTFNKVNLKSFLSSSTSIEL